MIYTIVKVKIEDSLEHALEILDECVNRELEEHSRVYGNLIITNELVAQVVVSG